MANCTEIQYVPGQLFGNGEPNLRGECSGNGVCVPSLGRCVCNEGWTSNTDFFGDTGTDCQISTLGIQIEYGLLLAITLYSWYVQYPGLKKRYTDFAKAKEIAASKGSKLSIFDNRGLFTIALWNIFGAPCIIITCILRIAVPEERVGVTISQTIFFLVVKFALYLASLLYQPYLFATLLKGESLKGSSGTRFLQFVKVTSYVGFLISAVGCFIPFISVADRSLAAETFIAYYVSQALGLFYNGAIAIMIYFKAEKLFSASFSVNGDDRTLKIKERMQGFQKVVFVNANIFAVLYIIFLIWPFWWNLHDYFVAITWLAFIKFANGIALGTNEKKSSKSNKPSSGTGTVSDKLAGDVEPSELSESV